MNRKNLMLGVVSLVVATLAAGAVVTLSAKTGSSLVSGTKTSSGFETVAAACKTEMDRYGCLAARAARLNISNIDEVDNFFAAVDNDELGPGCYVAAEKVGRAAWAAHGDDALAAGSPKCEGGYLSGVLIAARGAGKDQAYIANGCESASQRQADKSLWTPSMMYTCLVGAGRAYADAGDVKNLKEGVTLCETLFKDNMTEEMGKFKAIDFCLRGVVIDLLDENMSVKDALGECLSLGGTRTDACLALGLRSPGLASEQGTADLANGCKELKDKKSEHFTYCYFVLSDVLAQKLYFSKQKVEDGVVAICAEDVNCTGHYAKYLLTATWDPQGTIEACKLLGAGAVACANSVPHLTRDGVAQGHIPASKAEGLPADGEQVDLGTPAK